MKFPDKRLALINLSRSALLYGGIGTHTMSVIQCAEKAGFAVDLYFDQHPQHRKRFIPKEFLGPFSDRTVVFDEEKMTLSSQLNPLASAFDVFSISQALRSFFNNLQTRVYDVVIFNELFIALGAIMSGFNHPSMWVYLHEHELFMNYTQSSLIPLWKRELMREILRTLPVTGYLVQCSESIQRVSSVMEKGKIIGEKIIKCLPITLPGCAIDYSGEREGIAFVGSGEQIKNPELTISIIEKANIKETVHFYVGRGANRLKKLLNNVEFPYVIHEKLSRTDMLHELSKHKVGIHTAKCEGYGLAVVEQMFYYPMLIWGKPEWANHFPSAIKFSSIEDGANKLLDILSNDNTWKKAIIENEKFLAFNDIKKTGKLYLDLLPEKSNAQSSKTVRELVEIKQIVSFSECLSFLDWADSILAANITAKWDIRKYNTKKETFFVADSYIIPDSDENSRNFEMKNSISNMSLF